MSKRLRQVIKLIKETGDKVIVFDNSAPEDSFIVMDLEGYKKLLKPALTTQEFDVKIEDVPKKTESEALCSENIYSSAEVLKHRFKGNGWQIPKEIKENAAKDE